VIAGVHSKELSGIEVVRWLLAKLNDKIEKSKETWRPKFITIIVPQMFPTRLARQCQDAKAKKLNKDLRDQCQITEDGRERLWQGNNRRPDRNSNYYAIPPNRQFPPPGNALTSLISHNGPTDPDGHNITRDASPSGGVDMGENVPLLPETRYLVRLIEQFKPKRIATVHGHSLNRADYGEDAPGIFIDPRYEYDKVKCQSDPLAPVGSNQIVLFGTGPNKCDLTIEPSAPFVGLVKQMREWIAINKPKRAGDKAAQKLIGMAEANLDKAVKDFVQTVSVKRLSGDNLANEMKNKIQPQAESTAISLQGIGFVRSKLNPISAWTPKGQEDDKLALQMASAMLAKDSGLIPGNHLSSSKSSKPRPAVIHYAAPAGAPPGFSLGDWAPVDVKDPDGKRDGAPVYTIEVYGDGESKAFREDGVQIVRLDGTTPTRPEDAAAARQVNVARCLRLQIYADVLMDIFLES